MGTYSFSIDSTLVTDHISKQRTLVPSVAAAGGAAGVPLPRAAHQPRSSSGRRHVPAAGSGCQHSQQPGERRPPCPLYWGLILQRRTSPGTASHPPRGARPLEVSRFPVTQHLSKSNELINCIARVTTANKLGLLSQTCFPPGSLKNKASIKNPNTTAPENTIYLQILDCFSFGRKEATDFKYYFQIWVLSLCKAIAVHSLSPGLLSGLKQVKLLLISIFATPQIYLDSCHPAQRVSCNFC